MSDVPDDSFDRTSYLHQKKHLQLKLFLLGRRIKQITDPRYTPLSSNGEALLWKAVDEVRASLRELEDRWQNHVKTQGVTK